MKFGTVKGRGHTYKFYLIIILAKLLNMAMLRKFILCSYKHGTTLFRIVQFCAMSYLCKLFNLLNHVREISCLVLSITLFFKCYLQSLGYRPAKYTSVVSVKFLLFNGKKKR
jgi:hypothetical protein